MDSIAASPSPTTTTVSGGQRSAMYLPKIDTAVPPTTSRARGNKRRAIPR